MLAVLRTVRHKWQRACEQEQKGADLPAKVYNKVVLVNHRLRLMPMMRMLGRAQVNSHRLRLYPCRAPIRAARTPTQIYFIGELYL